MPKVELLTEENKVYYSFTINIIQLDSDGIS